MTSSIVLNNTHNFYSAQLITYILQIKLVRLLRVGAASKTAALLRWGSYHLPFVIYKFVHLDALAPSRGLSAFSIDIYIYRFERNSRLRQ